MTTSELVQETSLWAHLNYFPSRKVHEGVCWQGSLKWHHVLALGLDCLKFTPLYSWLPIQWDQCFRLPLPWLAHHGEVNPEPWARIKPPSILWLCWVWDIFFTEHWKKVRPGITGVYHHTTSHTTGVKFRVSCLQHKCCTYWATSLTQPTRFLWG